MIHFAHGNGFPSECYQQFFKNIEEQYQLFTIDKIGHNKKFPVTDNWQYLVDEIIESITSQCSQKVIGLGHSLGGVLTLLASYKRPDLFNQVILLDAPAFGFAKSHLIKIIKKLDLMHLVTPVKSTQRRVVNWGSRQQLKDYLLSKDVYQKFNKNSLDDYIKYGMIINESGEYELTFDRNIEAQIYKTMPHNMYKSRAINNITINLIYGHSSNIITAHDLRLMKKKYLTSVQACIGGHLFPFEFPEQASKLVLELIIPTRGINKK